MGRKRPHLLIAHNFYPDLDGVQRYGGAEQKDTTPDGSIFPDLDAFDALKFSMRLRVVTWSIRQVHRSARGIRDAQSFRI